MSTPSPSPRTPSPGPSAPRSVRPLDRSPLHVQTVNAHQCTPEHRHEQLSRTDYFAGLSSADIGFINEFFSARPAREGERIYLSGDRSTHLIVIAHGAVKTVRTTSEGHETILGIAGPGDAVGALPVAETVSHRDTAIALTDGCHLYLDAAAFERVVMKFPRVGLNALHLLGTQLQDTESTVHAMAGLRLEARLARTLLALGKKLGTAWTSPSGNPAILLDIPLSRDDLASLCGASSESVSRVMSAWKRAHIIDSGRRWTAITNPSALIERTT